MPKAKTEINDSVVLSIPPDHLPFLRVAFAVATEGWATSACEVPLADDFRDLASACFRVQLALDTDHRIEPSPALSEAVANLAETVDESNDYEQADFEHRALAGLLSQLRWGGEAA